MRIHLRFLAPLLALVVAAPVALADPKHKDKPGKGPGGRGQVARFTGGPPPWAPAHGYRAKQGNRADQPLDLDLGRCNRALIGQLLGGAAGAAAGSQIGDGRGRVIAIIGGTIAGVLLGGEIGRAMDRADQLCFDQVLDEAPDGRTVGWQDPDAGRRYTVTPRETYRNNAGRYCREYTAQSTIGGEPVDTYGTVCRQPDGSWEIVS
jgi:surface antigen